MLKSAIKEIFIILLLCIAIILILGIILYDYIPINTEIPTAEAYVTPNNVQQEMEEEIIQENDVTIITYEVTDSDLNVYKQTGSYVEGKANPFSLSSSSNTSTNTDSNEENADGNTNTSGNTSTNENTENTNVDQNSTGTFFNDEGIK